MGQAEVQKIRDIKLTAIFIYTLKIMLSSKLWFVFFYSICYFGATAFSYKFQIFVLVVDECLDYLASIRIVPENKIITYVILETNYE